jgi:hypothetical protein
MSRRNQRRGQQPALLPSTQGVEPVAQAALDNTADFHLDTNGPKAPPLPKMARVKLLRNYRPMEALDPTDPAKKRRLPPVFEIVGHTKPAIIVRNKLGKDEELEPAKFIEGEPAPSSKAGVGYADKLWAGTVVRVTTDEAKYMRAHAIGEIEIDD